MAIPISHPSFGLEVAYLCKASSPQAWGWCSHRKAEQVPRGLDPAGLDHMPSLTQPLQSHQCRVKPSTLQPPWAMILLRQGRQEKVGLL